MHEASVTADIMDAVLRELRNYEFSRVNEVTVVVGDLTQLGYEQMQFAWEVLTESNILRGSKLIIKPEHVMLRCNGCGFEGPAKTIDFGEDSPDHNIPVLSCPECGGKVEVIGGSACRIDSFDIDTADGKE